MNVKALQRRVLIVDDNFEAAELLQILLELQGYDARVAISGEGGIDQATDYRPHAICSDIMMPGMSGLEMVETLKKTDCCPQTLFVAISGYSGESTAESILAAGFDFFFVKPISFDDVYGCLATHFARTDLPL
jgi:two-component system, sensor histidine kinase